MCVPTLSLRAFVCVPAICMVAFAQGGSYTCKFTEIPIQGSSISGVYGLGINDSDVVVGSFYDGATQYGFFWTQNEGVHSYLLPGTEMTTFNGINDANQMVGAAMTSENAGYGIGYSDGTLSHIKYPSAAVTAAEGINKLGEVVGFYDVSEGQNGFALVNGKFTSIEYPGGDTTQVLGINDSGEMAGTYTTFLGLYNHGFILNQGQYTSLDYPDAQFTILSGINDNEVSAGYYFGSNDELGGFVYENGEYLNVTIPGATSLTTNGINNKGDITGQVTVASGNQEFYVGTSCK